MQRTLAMAYGGLCYLVFFLTFLYLIGFNGNLLVPKGVDDGTVIGTLPALLVNLVLIALFGMQHSVMARPGFKAAWTRVVPVAIERSTFVLFASLLLVLMFWQWRPMPQVIWDLRGGPVEALLWLVFACGYLLVLLSTFVIDHFDLFGLRQVWFNFRDKSYHHPGFKVTFFYKFVRHPLYLGFIMAFWAAPLMTLGHLVFAAGMTSFILIAVRYEERDLAATLGDDYRRYQQRVPMLVPRPGSIHETVKPAGAKPAVE